ncbi:hypothetical protein AGMMS49959_15550 [Planctomycetales bacterium]|nr:hypothetical protein AGMMS49959_15550 [Planctomycetales bacterium]
MSNQLPPLARQMLASLFPRRHRRWVKAALVVAGLAAAYFYSRGDADAADRSRRVRETRQIVRVVDGDTLLLDGKERVRLLGVDTPESKESDKLYRVAAEAGVKLADVVALGKLATAETEKLCRDGKCQLVYDEQQGRKDNYGRTLAYVYLPDGVSLNAELIKRGYATVYRHYQYGEKKRFLALEAEARADRRGLWKNKIFQKMAKE